MCVSTYIREERKAELYLHLEESKQRAHHLQPKITNAHTCVWSIQHKKTRFFLVLHRVELCLPCYISTSRAHASFFMHILFWKKSLAIEETQQKTWRTNASEPNVPATTRRKMVAAEAAAVVVAKRVAIKRKADFRRWVSDNYNLMCHRPRPIWALRELVGLFIGFSWQILKSIINSGYNQPTPIQRKVTIIAKTMNNNKKEQKIHRL